MFFGLGKPPSPNTIDTIEVPGTVGSLGLMPCPGVRFDQGVGTVAARRTLQSDIEGLKNWGANGVVSLIEAHEFTMNKVEELPDLLKEAGIWWLHLPIIDMDIPSQEFEDNWAVEGERIRHALRIGEHVALHCYAGLGRTGMIGARLLVEMGMTHQQAITAVRHSNKRRIQTKRQSQFVRKISSLL